MSGRNKLISVIVGLAIIVTVFVTIKDWSLFGSKVNTLKGSITGNTYTADFYSNTGENFMTVHGTNIDLEENVVRERSYSSEGGSGYVNTLSSVITITIDGHQIESCGSSIIFKEQGLVPDIVYPTTNINSVATSLEDLTMVSSVVNRYKNAIGKPVAVVIQSQLGDPICAFSGNKVSWEVCEDLPKTTKLFIDGRALYIHRANFQIIDKELLD